MLQPADVIIKGKFTTDRSSHPEMFYKTGVKTSKNFTETPVLDSLSNNFGGL